MFLYTDSWILPSGQQVGWVFNLTTGEIQNCHLIDELKLDMSEDDDPHAHRYAINYRKADPETLEQIKNHLQQVEIQSNWKEFKRVFYTDYLPE